MTNNNSLDKVGQSQPNGVHHQDEEPEKVAEEDTGSVKDSVNTGLVTSSIFFCFFFVKSPPVGEILFSSVPPSNSLVSVSDP